ncbi:MAG: YaiO family outer rane beta-barrel protein [Pseudomonadota bacterium]
MKILPLLAALGLSGLFPFTALAGEAPAQTVSVDVSTQDFSQGFGALRILQAEYRRASSSTAVIITPVLGLRKIGTVSETAAGGSVTAYHDWSPDVSTRTQVFLAEDKSPFAHVDLAQDVNVKLAHRTSLLLGGRYARYHGGQNVVFGTLGLRQYFGGVSLAYRATLTKPDGQRAFVAHLASVTVNDAKGAGKTQLWLSSGSASPGALGLHDTFRGQDRAAYLQRIQPLSGKLAATFAAGLSSYDRPSGRLTGHTFALGLKLALD